MTVRGGYRPDVVQVRQGVPVEIEFDRQESGDCTSRVVFPDLQLSAALPAHEHTTVRFTPSAAGSFGFACGMNMIHGTLVVTPGAPGHDAAPHAVPDGASASAAEVEAAQARERQAEIRDLTRRVVLGAVLTAPVPFAVMAQSLSGADWVPGVLPGQTVAADFDAGNPGQWMIHCHHTYHAETGMAAVLGYRGDRARG